MLKYLILVLVIMFLLQKNIESFNGIIERTGLVKKEKQINYVSNNGEHKTTKLSNVPSLEIINTKLGHVKNELLRPYGDLLSTTDDISIKKLKNTEDKIKIKDIYTFL